VGGKEEVGMTLSMKSWAVIVVVALLVAVSLVVLLVPSLSGAAAPEWFTNLPEASPCGCILGE
jgi:hypothetical protein